MLDQLIIRVFKVECIKVKNEKKKKLKKSLVILLNSLY